ncbi:MAG: hypothetical protein HIU57_07910 [Acidobacteria bacterium]|nr:hypothetical protein [Acidobacteriota bacterium]
MTTTAAQISPLVRSGRANRRGHHHHVGRYFVGAVAKLVPHAVGGELDESHFDGLRRISVGEVPPCGGHRCFWADEGDAAVTLTTSFDESGPE